MYSTRTSARINSIESIPFTALYNLYDDLMGKSYEIWKSETEEYNKRAVVRFEEEWNKTHEESFEGDLESQNIYKKTTPFSGKLNEIYMDEFNIKMEEFVKKYSIQHHADWIFPQMLAKFGNLSVDTLSDGMYDGESVYKQIRESPFLTGMYIMCMYPQRSLFIKGQTDEKFRNYCALVPLILSAFKKHKNILYSKWNKESIKRIVEPKLYSVMMMESLPDLTKEEVLEARTAGLTIKSGAKMGEVRPIRSTFTLYIPSGMGFDGLEMLAKIMICQTWAAHPSLRTEYMILNPLDWDNAPEPLIGSSALSYSDIAEETKSRALW